MDLVEQQTLGLEPSAEAFQAIRGQLAELTQLPDDADVPRVIEATYRTLAQAPSLARVATLEDALAVTDRPNVPGTGRAHRPNWSLALPATLEQLERSRLARAVASALARPSASNHPERGS